VIEFERRGSTLHNSKVPIIFWEHLCEVVAPLFDMFSRNFFSLGKGSNYYGPPPRQLLCSFGTLGMQSRWERVYLTPILKVGGCNTRGPKASPAHISRVYAILEPSLKMGHSILLALPTTKAIRILCLDSL